MKGVFILSCTVFKAVDPRWSRGADRHYSTLSGSLPAPAIKYNHDSVLGLISPSSGDGNENMYSRFITSGRQKGMNQRLVLMAVYKSITLPHT